MTDAKRELVKTHLKKLPAVGDTKADRILSAFGGADETIRALDRDPMRILDVAGISPRVARNLIVAWRAHRAKLTELLESFTPVRG